MAGDTEKLEQKPGGSQKGGGAMSDVFDSSSVADEPRRRRGKKVIVDLKCPFCESGVATVTYKDVYQLKKYTSVRGKIIGRDRTGMCAKHQRQLSVAIKKARYMALLPYVSLTTK